MTNKEYLEVLEVIKLMDKGLYSASYRPCTNCTDESLYPILKQLVKISGHYITAVKDKNNFKSYRLRIEKEQWYEDGPNPVIVYEN